MAMNFEGTWVALATPFRGGALDEAAYRALCKHVLVNGADGLVPCGTTGETATLSAAEQARCVSIAVEVGRAAGKPVVAGAGSNSTDATCRTAAAMRELGVDGVLVVTPYYNKPTQAGLVAHYRALAQAVPGLPIVAYNVPGRTGVDLLPATYPALAEVEEVVAVKEATGSLTRIIDIREQVGDRFVLLSGDDFTVAPFIAMGGRGVISVSGNVAPARFSALVRASLAGDVVKASALQVELNALHRALFLEPNPIPLKAALALLGLSTDELRLPLVPASLATRKALTAALGGLSLLEEA